MHATSNIDTAGGWCEVRSAGQHLGDGGDVPGDLAAVGVVGGVDLGEHEPGERGVRPQRTQQGDRVLQGSMAATSTEPRKPQPWPSRNSRLASRWDWVSWSVVICRTDAGDNSRRPPALPPASNIRAKECQSSAVEARPPAPEGTPAGCSTAPRGVNQLETACRIGPVVAGEPVELAGWYLESGLTPA